jgi:hypothetical protein
MTPLKFCAKARLRLKEWFENGDYIGWLATPADKPETVVGGAGVQLQPILRRPLDASRIGEGRQGNDCECFYRTAMATARHRRLARYRDHYLVEERADLG